MLTSAVLERFPIVKTLILGHPLVGALDGSGGLTALNTQRTVVGQAVGFSAAAADGRAGFASAAARRTRVAKGPQKRARRLGGSYSRDSRVAPVTHHAVYRCLAD